jgi:hypothetical protein
MRGKVSLLIIAVSLALLVPTAAAGSDDGQSATAVIGTLIIRDPLSVIYEEDAAGDLYKKAFRERMAGTYTSLDGGSARLKRQMALFAQNCRAMARHLTRLAADEWALAMDRTPAVAERGCPSTSDGGGRQHGEREWRERRVYSRRSRQPC